MTRRARETNWRTVVRTGATAGPGMKYEVTVAGRIFEIEVRHNRLVEADGRPLYVDLEQVGGLPVYSLTLDDMGYVVFVEEGQGRVSGRDPGPGLSGRSGEQTPPVGQPTRPIAQVATESAWR